MGNLQQNGDSVVPNGAAGAYEVRRAGDGVWLFQRAKGGAEVDVVGLAVEDEGGHRFDAGVFRFRQTRLLFPEVDDLYIIASFVQCGGKVLFSGNTDRASSVVEDSLVFHTVCFGSEFVVMRAVVSTRGHRTSPATSR